MIAGLHRLRDGLLRHEGAEREAAAMPFAIATMSGAASGAWSMPNIFPVRRSRLDLVDDEERAVFVEDPGRDWKYSAAARRGRPRPAPARR
jgi:hypothetical protein